MKQITIKKYGSPVNLILEEAASELPPKGFVKINVSYSGVNFADLMCRLGLYPGAPKPPFVPGYEVTGVVDSVGDSSLNELIGKPVLAVTEFGGYASEVIVNRKNIIPLQSENDLKKAAAVPVNYFTAYGMMVTQANIQPGEWLLIHGIGGGVGIAALQLGKKLGSRIIGTASSHKHERLKSMGVEYLIDYQHENFVERVKDITGGLGADVILDPIGGTNTKKSYKSLAPLGRLIAYGFSTAATRNRRMTLHSIKEYMTRIKFDPLKLMLHNKGIFGFHLGRLQAKPDFHEKVVTVVMDWFNDKTIEPVIDKIYSFSQAAEAHQYIHEHRNFGKVLLSPDD